MKKQIIAYFEIAQQQSRRIWRAVLLCLILLLSIVLLPLAIPEPAVPASLPETALPTGWVFSEPPLPEDFHMRFDLDPEKPMIALTFDDGPAGRPTENILNLLEEHGGRATFFVLGSYINGRQSAKNSVLRAYHMGNEIVGHSWRHQNLTKMSAEAVEKDILDTQAAIQAIIGVEPPRMFRPPGGAINDTVRNVSRDLGFCTIYWSIDTRDWRTKNADATYAAIMGQARDRAIVLCHDLQGSTAIAMERVIPELIARGYQLVTVSELFFYSGIETEPGHSYFNAK